MRLAFISAPSRGVIRDGAPTEQFLRDVARLHEQHPTFAFIVPMIQDYALVPFLETPATWAEWGERCSAKLAACAELWVIQYRGWEFSEGVLAEIALGHERQIPVRFLSPDTLLFTRA